MQMKRIDEIDSNLKVQTTITEPDIKFIDVRQEPFQVYGLYDYKNEPVFKRLPDKLAESVNEGVAQLYLNTAGGRVRFSTNSSYIAIKVNMPYVNPMPHMPLSGSAGFDMFIDEGSSSRYYGTFMPPIEMQDGYESIIFFSQPGKRKITINFPLYNCVNSLYIGLQNSSSIGKGEEYAFKKPVLYYGSSITQGGCASRPGNSYQAIISRRFNCDYINLGFSGSGRGEDSIVDYMSKMDVSVFVCDYDYNAPNTDHLTATHEKMFRKFRKKSPDLPIVLISKPDFEKNTVDSIRRRNVIYTTFMNAINDGDKNVYFIDGQSLFMGENRDCCTVDGCHPNDIGFLRMADVIGNTVGQILSGSSK